MDLHYINLLINEIYNFFISSSTTRNLFFIVLILVVLILILTWCILKILNYKYKKFLDKKEFEIFSSAPKKIDKSIPEESIQETFVDDIEEILLINPEKWLQKLKSGLSKTRTLLYENLKPLFLTKNKLDDELLEKIYATLYKADLGVKTVNSLISDLKKQIKKEEIINFDVIINNLKNNIKNIFLKAEVLPFRLSDEIKPFVILIVGVNGVGKTTTIGKLAAHFLAQKRTVLLGAADTFRAAAIEQLEVWGKRLGVGVISNKQGSDPAAVAFDTVKSAKSKNIDVVLIDTAGRLHNKVELMDELTKIKKVLSKEIPQAPHDTWLVLDAHTGQNAVSQVKVFKKFVDISGIVITKLDGTAKGGAIIGIFNEFNIPIRYIGVGEKPADLREFNVDDFVNSLFDQ